MKKWQTNRGETLVETLVALLIATLVLLFLSTSIATASRVNKKVRDTDTSFHYSAQTATQGRAITVTVKGTGTYQESFTTIQYTDNKGGYRYYEGVTNSGG